MIVAQRYECIFIQVPMTEGGLVRDFLKPHVFNMDWVLRPDAKKNPLLHNNHIGAATVRSLVDDQTWEEFAKFSFARNPWDLMVSHYMFFKQSTGDDDLSVAASNKGFNQYIDWYFHDPNQNFGFRQGFEMFFDIDGENVLDRIGRFEHFDEDFHSICEYLGITRPEKFKKLNAISRRPYAGYYDATSRKVVERAFEKYLDQFKYSF